MKSRRLHKQVILMGAIIFFVFLFYSFSFIDFVTITVPGYGRPCVTPANMDWF